MSDASVAIRITVDDSSASSLSTANSSLTDMSANWDQVGLSGAKAARSLTSGLSGLLSAEQNIYNAQQRVNVAQINYTLTVREYGQGSIQASKALIQLQQAQEGVTIAQDQLDLRFVQFALTTGPQFYTAITRAIAASQGMTLANYEETASWYAKAAAITATAIALAAVTFGFSALVGGAAAAATSSTLNQTNNIYGASTSSAVAGATSSLRSAVRP